MKDYKIEMTDMEIALHMVGILRRLSFNGSGVHDLRRRKLFGEDYIEIRHENVSLVTYEEIISDRAMFKSRSEKRIKEIFEEVWMIVGFTKYTINNSGEVYYSLNGEPVIDLSLIGKV